MLLFKKKFLDAIRSGEKTQTIRLWKFAKMCAGQRSYVPGVGYIRIEAVDRVELAELTDDDARPDGFATADALRAEIAALYAKYHSDDQKAFRIKFSRLLDEPAKKRPPARTAVPVKTSQSTSTKSVTANIASAKNSTPSCRTPLPADGYPLDHKRSH